MIKVKIKELAEKNGVTTAYQLQKKLNIQPSLAAKWYRNDLKMIGIESLNSLCAAFKCLPSDILIYVADADMAQISNTESTNVKPSNAESSNTELYNALSEITLPNNTLDYNPIDISDPEGDEPDEIGNPISGYLLTSGDAGKFLNLSPRTVREYAEKEELEGIKNTKGHWFFRRDSLREFKAQRESRDK
jgi:DNA-binding Xre family transcriptional regulator